MQTDSLNYTEATWDQRLGAYILDVVVVGAFSFGVFKLINFFTDGMLNDLKGIWLGNINILSFTSVLFLYWMIFEWLFGQSLGKRLAGLKVVDEHGNDIDLVTAIVETFGTVAFPVLDAFFGWLLGKKFWPHHNLRVFNHITNTRVIDIGSGAENTRFGLGILSLALSPIIIYGGINNWTGVATVETQMVIGGIGV
ncbi:MAG: RDD family protein, partial [Candidatus Paceibacteria bacterium]